MKSEDVKIVFPLDVPTLDKGRALMADVGEVIDLPKVGLELIHFVGTPAAIAMSKEFGKPPFVDAKLNDIPATVRGAAKGITSHGVYAFNVMASGGRPMMEAAMEGANEMARELGIERPKVIAVTVLTSLKPEHLIELGMLPEMLARMSEEEKQAAINELAIRWARASVKAGVDIILSSPKEVAEIHARWPHMVLYTPGIRMPYSPPDDQGRTMSPGEAVLNGSQYLVIGRPIRNPEGDRTRKQVVAEIRADIAQALAGKMAP
jgi:orotidine-5'-phosphate decarboxylase